MPRPARPRITRWAAHSGGIAVALAMAGVLAGCSVATNGSQPSSAGTDHSASAASVPSSPSAAATTSAAVQGVAHIKDGDGYTFDVSYSLTPLAYAKDISAEKPGFNAVRISVRASITVTNTTPGRTISFKPVTGVTNGDPLVELKAYWPRSSVVCAALQATIEDRCDLKMAFTQPGTEVGAGATSTAQTFAGFFGLSPGVAHVPDADYDAVLAALKHPAGYAIAYAGYDNDRFTDTCPSQINDSAIPIFDTSGTCVAASPLSQPALD